MAKRKKAYEIIVDKTVEILTHYPEGLDYGRLTEIIFEELPEIERNTVHGTLNAYFKKFEGKVIKPRRGFYKLANFNSDNNSQATNKSSKNEIENDLSVINGKLLRIKLKNFQQFKDVELDLTIPDRAVNAGQPLEKVCIIGQSGTGKSTLLNIIRFFSMSELSKRDYPIIKVGYNSEIEIDYLIPAFAKVRVVA